MAGLQLDWNCPHSHRHSYLYVFGMYAMAVVTVGLLAIFGFCNYAVVWRVNQVLETRSCIQGLEAEVVAKA